MQAASDKLPDVSLFQTNLSSVPNEEIKINVLLRDLLRYVTFYKPFQPKVFVSGLTPNLPEQKFGFLGLRERFFWSDLLRYSER